MSAVWLAVRARLRSGWRSALALVLLVGLGGGIAMAALSGARRTGTALDRFLRYTTVNSAVAYVTPPTGNQAYAGVPADEVGRRRAELVHLAAIRALPDVAWAGRMMPVVMATQRPGHPDWRVTLGYVPLDGTPEETYGRPILVSGRLPDAARADEVAVNEELAARAGLRIGSRLPVGVYTSAQFADVGNGRPLTPEGVRRALRVVGIVRYPPDVLPRVLERDDFSADHSVLWLTPAFGGTMGADVANYGVGVMTRLRHGAAVGGLQHEVAAAVGSDQVDVQRNVLVGFNVNAVADIGKATDVETLALAGFSVLTALATALLLWQALRRQLALEGNETPTLAALGMGERELVWTSSLSAVWIGLAGGIVAAITAVALSPLLPIGVARRMEVDLGAHLDAPVLSGGVVAVFLLVTGAGALTGWGQARATRRPAAGRGEVSLERPTGLGRLLGSAALPVTATTGMRMALVRGRGRTGVPVTTLLVGAAIGVAAATAAVVFSASLAGLIDQPARYGATADAAVGNYADVDSSTEGAARLASEADVQAYVGVTSAAATINGRSAPLLQRFTGRGEVPIVMIDGVPPTGDGEIALGLKTMRALGTSLGDMVSVRGAREPKTRQLRVVGVAVLSSQGDAEVEPGEGAVVERAAPTPTTFPTNYLVRFRDGVDREAAAGRLRRDFYDSTAYPTFPPTIVRTVERVAYLPSVLAGVVVLLALGTLLHGLTVVLRRRRRDLAVLQAVGFSGHQVLGSVVVQASTIAVVGVAVGIPLGVAIGRTGWHLTADALGVAAPAALPAIGFIAMAVATLVIVNLLALVGWKANRAPLGPALRAE